MKHIKSKKQTASQKPILIVGILIIFILGILMVIKNNTIINKQGDNQEDIQQVDTTFQSRKFPNLGVELEIPSGWQIEERVNSLELITTEGSITITKINTNFETIEEHLEYLDEQHHINSNNIKNLIINSFKVILRDEIFSNGDSSKAYYFYPHEYSIYVLSTSQSNLNSKLEQVAQSIQFSE